MIPFALGIACILAALWLHRAKRRPWVGRHQLAWTDPAGWRHPLVILLYLAGAALVLGGALRGLL